MVVGTTALVVVALAACSSPRIDPVGILDELGWPEGETVVFTSDLPDPSCGSPSCVSTVRYLTLPTSADEACAQAAGALDATYPALATGCLVTACIEDHLVNVNISSDRQPVFEPGGPSEVNAPAGGVAVALRARQGC